MEEAIKESGSRRSRVVKLLNQSRLDGLVIYSNGAYRMTRPTYVHFFSGLRPLGSHNAVIINKSGKSALLLEPQWDSIRASRKSWISDIRGTSEFAQDLIALLVEFDITGTIGVTGSREMREGIYAGIAKIGDIVSAEDILEEISREITRENSGNIRKTARIADIGFNALLEKTRIGIREYELAAEVNFSMRSSGAEDVFFLLSSGRHNDAMHAPTDRRLRNGDIVIAEITPVCEGQFFQLCNTVFIGKPNPILLEKYKMLAHSLEESLKLIKSGAPAALISKAMNKIIGDAGYSEYCYPPYMRARGHGTGPGSIVGSSALGGTIDDHTKALLKRDQSIVVHPNQYLPETGYLACGETVLVTDTGIERLSETKPRLYIKEV